jgi:cytochrome P450
MPTPGSSYSIAPGPPDAFPESISLAWQDLLGLFLDANRQYGDVVRFRIDRQVVHLLCHPDHIKHVLQDRSSNYHKTAIYERGKSVLGQGLLSSEGDFGLRQRRLMQPGFHIQRLATLVTVMTDVTAESLDRWGLCADSGQALNISSEMVRLCLQIVGKAIFGTTTLVEADQVGIALKTVFKQLARSLETPFAPPENVTGSGDQDFQEALHTLEGAVYSIIDEHRHKKSDNNSLLSMLLLARNAETGESMDIREVRDEAMTLFFAGYSTTAIALTWIWQLLAMSPLVERQLHTEVDDILGGRTPTFTDLPQLTYTSMVIKESLRIHPPSWMIARSVVQDDEISGYYIPGGTLIFLSPYITHRHPAFWNNPEHFDPQRFAPERALGRPRYAYFPFSGGPHQCIGNNFAMILLQLVITMIAQRYSLRPTFRHSTKPEHRFGLSTRKSMLILRRRLATDRIRMP